MVTRALPLLLLVVLCSSAAGAAADAVETARGFFDAWAAGDAVAASQSWSTPSSPEFDRHVRRAVTVSCIDVHDVRIAGARELADGRVEVAAELWLTRTSARPGAQPRHEVAHPVLRLRREEGRWKIVQWTSREELLIDELLALPSPVARAERLERASEEWTPELVRALLWRSTAQINRGEMELAREAVGYADRIAGDLGDDLSRAYALTAASSLARSQPRPDFPQVVALADQAVALAERAGDPDALAIALVRAGRATAEVERPELFHRALDLADFVEDLTPLAMAATNLAYHYATLGENRLSLLHAGMAARHAETAGSKSALIGAEMNYGALYHSLGDPELGALHYMRAYELGRELGFARIYVSFLDSLVSTRLAAGHPPEELLQIIDEALTVPALRTHRTVPINLISVRARVNVAMGRLEEAEQDIALALAHEAAGEHPWPYFVLAELRMLQKRYADAKTAMELAPRLWTIPQWTLYIDAMRALGETGDALFVANCGIEYAETAFTKTAVSERNRQTYLANRYPMEQILVELLVQRGQSDEALLAAEAAKARVLRDAASRTRSAADARSPEAAAERALAEKVETLNRALLAERDEQRVQTLRADLAKVRLELDDARVRAVARVPGHELYSDAFMQWTARWPFPDTVALQYMVGERQTIIFAVRSGTSPRPRVDVVVVPVERAELGRLVQQLRERIAARDLRHHEPAKRLYALLIAPVESIVASRQTLCVVPDGDLWKVPFQALRGPDGRALVERTAVFYSPSIQMLNTLRGRRQAPRQPRLLAIGNPRIEVKTAARFRAYERSSAALGDLLEAETEVQEIARLYGRGRSSVYVREQAREAVFKTRAADFDILHIAAHGLVDDNAPAFSAVVLAASTRDEDDGLLEAREVAELKLDARLVVLSACDTAAGRVGGGEGLLGLSWAFLAAGADGLVGSQWKAPSAATERLMVAFHERLVAGDSPAQALRQAQRRLLRDERYSAPLDWASFIVVGNGL